ncbi:hypothetical protein JOM56_009958 [Amanita muscaria]
MRFTIVIATIILSMTGFAVCKAAHGSSQNHHSSSFQTSMKVHASKSLEALKESKTYVGNLTLYPVVTRHDGHRSHRVSRNKKLDVLSRRIEKQLPSLILDSERWKIAYESGPPKLMIPALCGLMTNMELTKKAYLKNAAAWNRTRESSTKGKDEKARIETAPVMISWPTTATLKQCKLA